MAAILTIAVAVVSLLFGIVDYPVTGHDSNAHLVWLAQFPQLRASGILYPRWMPLSFAGFGAPTFYFYPPLVYWLSSAVYSFLHATPEQLFNILQVFGSLISCLTAYLLLCGYTSEHRKALFGAMVYAFVGYHFADIYTRNVLTEHFAFAFVPLLFIRLPSNVRSIALYALAWSGLLLTNVPTALLAGVGVLVFSVANRERNMLVQHAIGGIVGILTAYVFLLPAVGLLSLTHAEHIHDLDMKTSGSLLLDLFSGPTNWLKILGTVTLASGVTIGVLSWSKKKLKPDWTWLWIVAAVAQIPILSHALFQLPGLRFIQFGYRFEVLLLLYIAVQSARTHDSRVLVTIAILSGFTLIDAAVQARHIFKHPSTPNQTYLFDTPEFAPIYSSSDPEMVQAITSRQARAPEIQLLGLVWPGDTVIVRRHGGDSRSFAVKLSRDSPVRLHQFYWPYWRLYRDGQPIALKPDVNGFAIATLPAGNYTLSEVLERSRYEEIGANISIVGASLLVLLLAAAAFTSLRSRDRSLSPLRSAP